MPVVLNIVESETALGVIESTVVIESASAPGPAGAGVPIGGDADQVLAKVSGTDFDTEWVDAAAGGGGGVTDATFLVATAHADLSDEVVVGATPGGELGGTWAAPTVDATHSGSTHAAVQAAAESTAAADATSKANAAQAASQPVDSDLTAIAALTTTAFGRGLLELANAAAGRTALGLGTAAVAATGDFDATGAAAAAQAASQPLDSDLTALAALTTTAYGRSLLEAANAAALRTLAGLVLGTDIYSKTAVDSGFQPLDADLTAVAAANNSAVLAATTASFLTADETKLDGIEALAEVNDTAAEILTKLLTVDGSGSGLDADLLDGQSSAAFETPGGAQSKADAKVTQTITNGVTTTAPSEDAVFDALALKAPLASPALTGSPTAPTQSAADNSTKIATTAYADAKVADAINDSTTGIAPSQNAVFDALALKAPLASPTLTGTPAAPTAAAGTDTTQLATTAYVRAEALLLDARFDLGQKRAVRLATAAAMPSAIFLSTTAQALSNGALTVDGVATAAGDLLLLKDQSTGSQNGPWTVTSAGSAGTPWTLTRLANADAAGELVAGAAVRAMEGTANAGKMFHLATTGTITPGTTAQVWVPYGLPGTMLARVEYQHASAAYTIASGTSTDVDATNLAVAFVVPPSGKVVVAFEGLVGQSSAAEYTLFSVRESSSDVVGPVRVTSIVGPIIVRKEFYVTGLTPGAAKTYKWGWSRGGAITSSLYTYSSATYPPAIIEVFAAP